ncbi:MAG: hypothetical protein COW02_17475 [Comamonadaceae bacterium CG12_big_fil_rev_8_21_14_0_65_59_15]|nr:MAG: hypothetical protein COW02_17475 [Comamonadaceae bacterium CG12_big_fil_rev_8_21_14_0_65_59_15]
MEQKIAPRYQRRIHYVDESIQKWLLVGLVVLEVALAAGLAWLMYARLSAVVEDNLYRIHMADTQPIATQLLHESARLLGIFVLVNAVALLLGDWLWRRYVQSILRAFRQMMAKTAALDFSVDSTLQRRHQLLDLTEQQRRMDRERLTAVRNRLTQLVAAQQAGDGAAVQQALNALDQVIPQGRAARPERRRAVR